MGLLLLAGLVPVKAAALALPSPAITAVAAPALTCQVAPALPSSDPSTLSRETGISKSATILGGTRSALDLIREQQAGTNLATDLPIGVDNDVIPAGMGSDTCLAMAPIAFPIAPPAPIIPQVSDTFLGSERIRINRTPFTQDWRRVSGAALDRNYVTNLVSPASSGPTETLARVNAWVNQNIMPVSDIVGRRARDHWATAAETLVAGSGDCEDYAILKYQMLAALGFERENMYLTLARDLVRNADHAVLIVRLDGRHYMLDNATDALLPADQSYDYRPTMSFNTQSGWIHGYVNRSNDWGRTLALR